MSPSSESVPESKWVKGVSEKLPLHEAAHRILQSRLFAVWHWLPLAADKSGEDVEYVHQLRVSTRRAVEAVRVFSDLVPKSARQALHARLRQVRLAADEARNLDVLCAEFVRCADKSCESTCGRIADAIRQRRQDAQQPIISVYAELRAWTFNDRITCLLEDVRSRSKGKSEPPFGRHAPRYLKPAVRNFFKASNADLSCDEALHNLRIRTKKLRYTMEIVETAFAPCFRKSLYRQISALQDVMGMVNDHATARVFFSEWAGKTEDAQQKTFFQGILQAEKKAHEDLRQVFCSIWTPKSARKLQRQFRVCCGIPRRWI